MAEESAATEGAKQAVLETTYLVEIVWSKVLGWVEGFVAMLPNLAVALLVVIFFAIAARIAAHFAGTSIRRSHASEQIASLAETCVRLALLGTGLFLALGLLDLQKTVTSLLAGVGVIGLALGFAFQDIASNFMSGVIMAIRRPFELGELVETGPTTGWIERVTLRATVVRNFSGQLVIIPNKDVLQSPIVNFSTSGARRIEIPVGVSYDCDLEQAREVLRHCIDDIPALDTSRDVAVVCTGFGGSSIDLSVRFWIDLTSSSADYLEARSLGIVAIKRALDEAEIEIPFPIRTLDFPAAFGASDDEDGPEQPSDAAPAEARA